LLDDGVKAYAELGAAALKAGESRLYRLWLVARACDATGRGWLEYGELESYAAGICSTQTLKRSLKLGDGSYWTLDARGRIWLAGLRRILERLECDLHAHPVYIPLEYLKRLGDFNAAMLAAFMAGKPRTIRQAKLAELYGRSTRTVTAYVKRAERLGLLKVTPQAALTDLPPRAAMIPALAEQGYFIVRVGGRQYTAKRMPNRYTSELCTAAFGAVKQYGASSSSTMRPTYRKLYYTNENSKGFTKALASLHDGEAVFVPTGGVSDDGRALWRMYERRDGMAEAV